LFLVWVGGVCGNPARVDSDKSRFLDADGIGSVFRLLFVGSAPTNSMPIAPMTRTLRWPVQGAGLIRSLAFGRKFHGLLGRIHGTSGLLSATFGSGRLAPPASRTQAVTTLLVDGEHLLPEFGLVAPMLRSLKLGARAVLRGDRPLLLIEVHPQFQPQFGGSVCQVVDFLSPMYDLEAWGFSPDRDSLGLFRSLTRYAPDRGWRFPDMETMITAAAAALLPSQFDLLCRPKG